MNPKSSLRAFAGLSALALSAMAQAQNVQIYGVLDAGVNRTTGLNGGSRTSLVSGIMDGSRLGFKGNEDLGGGFRTLFALESRLEVDTGLSSNRPFSESQVPDRLNRAALLGLPSTLQPVVNIVAGQLGSQLGVNLANRFWDRQVYLGLVTPVGAVLAGRQYTPAYEIAAAFDTTLTQSALSSGQIGSVPSVIDIRMDNTLSYRLQQGGVSAAVMVTAHENSRTTGRLLGINAMYKGAPFSAGVGYNARRNELGQTSLKTLVVGASLDAGPGTIVSSFSKIDDENPSGLSSLPAALSAGGVPAPAVAAVHSAFVRALKQDSRLYHVGYRVTSGLHTGYLAYSKLDDRLAPNADVASYGAVYTYSLSKRSDLNVALVHFDNRNLAQAAPGQAGMVGGVTARAGTDSNSFSFGLRHRF